MEKRIRFLEALQKYLNMNPGKLTPGSFSRRARILELISDIYFFNDSDDMLDWIRELIEIYLNGGTEWELQEALEQIRRSLIMERIERQAEKPYWERTTQALFERVLREFMKTYLLGTQDDRRLGKVISTLKLIRKAFKKDEIETLRVLATYMDTPRTKEKFVIEKLKEIINPTQETQEPNTEIETELPF